MTQTSLDRFALTQFIRTEAQYLRANPEFRSRAIHRRRFIDGEDTYLQAAVRGLVMHSDCARFFPWFHVPPYRPQMDGLHAKGSVFINDSLADAHRQSLYGATPSLATRFDRACLRVMTRVTDKVWAHDRMAAMTAKNWEGNSMELVELAVELLLSFLRHNMDFLMVHPRVTDALYLVGMKRGCMSYKPFPLAIDREPVPRLFPCFHGRVILHNEQIPIQENTWSTLYGGRFDNGSQQRGVAIVTDVPTYGGGPGLHLKRDEGGARLSPGLFAGCVNFNKEALARVDDVRFCEGDPQGT